jgi:hypothetical protein
MRALRVTINGGKPIVAGAEDLGVLSLIVSCVGPLGRKARPPLGEAEQAKLDLGGLTSRADGVTDEHVNWLSQLPLKVGDKIEVEILETDSPDPIDSASEAKRRESDARKYYQHCKETYLKLREHYEPEA